MKELSENLKRLRESRKVSKSELARLLNIAPSAYSIYETGLKEVGDREPTLTNLIKLADFFNVSVDELLNYHVNEYKRCKDLWESAGFETKKIKISPEEKERYYPNVVDMEQDNDGNFIETKVSLIEEYPGQGTMNFLFQNTAAFIEWSQQFEKEVEKRKSDYLKFVADIFLRKKMKFNFTLYPKIFSDETLFPVVVPFDADKSKAHVTFKPFCELYKSPDLSKFHKAVDK